MTWKKDERKLLSQNLVSYIGENLDQVYLDYIKSLQLNSNAVKTNLHIVYPPLRGTGQTLILQALQNADFHHITIIDEQKNRNPDFSTVLSLNSEEAQAFQLAIQYGKETGVDLLLATDLDADRLGVAVKNNSDG